MSALDQLLVVQSHDTMADQLVHRRANLAERDQLVEQERAMATVDDRTAKATSERHDLERQQKRYEDEVATVEAKIAVENEKLYGGGVTAIKELQALQDEIASLRRRQSQLEDQVLELMELIEPIDERLGQLHEARATIEANVATIQQRIGEQEAEIDGELAAVHEKRAAEADGLPTELVSEYERLRDQLGGVAVAELKNGTCMGCHLGLSAVEVDMIRKQPDGTVVHCEECGRILVR